MKQSRFPEGWDEERVRRTLKHYEGQTEKEADAEDLLELRQAKQEQGNDPTVSLAEVRKRFGLDE